ncbi:MAG: nuclear transport factor 2 family protein [Phenylobacterium sp.]|uniref:nuclear transport factor 2 family protein n=1 Tax=Phenylobacterium sp. TaxID=1871053 RepID=UPI00391B54C8
MTQGAIAGWHEFVRTRDPAVLHELLAEDAVFESPVVHTPQAGRPIVEKYLLAAMTVLGGDSFRYLGEWTAENSAVLEFACEIEGIAVNGVDMIAWNEAGKITRFKVMVRPLKAINLLHQMMGARLSAA